MTIPGAPDISYHAHCTLCEFTYDGKRLGKVMEKGDEHHLHGGLAHSVKIDMTLKIEVGEV